MAQKAIKNSVFTWEGLDRQGAKIKGGARRSRVS